jgi:hypothetical protein
MTWCKPRLSAWQHAPTVLQKSAKGVVATKAGKTGWSEGPNGGAEWSRVRAGE